MSRLFLFELTEKMYQKMGNKVLKNLGSKLFKLGDRLGNKEIPKSALLFDNTNTPVGNAQPKYHETYSNFIAPNNIIAGDVKIGQNVQINFSNLIQALSENSHIKINKNVLIQDLTTIKASKGQTTSIGDGTSIGSNCIIIDAQIGKNCTIGYGSKISKNCKIGNNVIIGAGSVLQENTEVPDNQVWLGNPAEYVREIEPEDQDILEETQQNYMKMGQIYNEVYSKNLEQSEIDNEFYKEFIKDDEFREMTTDDLTYQMQANNEYDLTYGMQQLDNVQGYLEMQEHRQIITKEHHIHIPPDQNYISEHLRIHSENYETEKNIEQKKDQFQVPNTDFFDKNISEDIEERWKRRY